MKKLFGPAAGGDGHIGTWVKSAAVESPEIMAFAGFDFVVIDLEHTPLSLSDAYRHIITASGLGLAPVVRVPDHTPATIQRLMDAGAAGVLVPHVDTAEQARRVAASLRFPPQGTRGSGNTSRAGKWGRLGRAEYTRVGNEDSVCIPQLESREAIENAAEILALPDVTAALVGASDLALDTGLAGDDPELQELIDLALAAGHAAGKGIGCAIDSDAEAAARSFARGFDFAVMGSDLTMLAKAACSVVNETRAVAA